VAGIAVNVGIDMSESEIVFNRNSDCC